MLLERIKELLPQVMQLIEMVSDYSKANNSSVRVNKEFSIKEYLRSFDFYDVILFETIMYIGRDEYIPKDRYEDVNDYYRDVEEFYDNFNSEQALRSLHKYLTTHNSSRETAINQMMEKSPLADYLRQGLHVLGVKRIYS